jgi:hypothetical protein
MRWPLGDSLGTGQYCLAKVTGHKLVRRFGNVKWAENKDEGGRMKESKDEGGRMKDEKSDPRSRKRQRRSFPSLKHPAHPSIPVAEASGSSFLHPSSFILHPCPVTPCIIAWS